MKKTYKEDILRLYSEGYTYDQIMKVLGCSKGVISYYINPKTKEKAIARDGLLRAKKRKIIHDLKESTPCFDCNVSYPYYVMQFDHTDPQNKTANVSEIIKNGKVDEALLEAEKCDIVCANCHAIRTWKKQAWKNRKS